MQRENRLTLESLPPTAFQVHYLINQRTPGASGAWNTAIDHLFSLQIKCFDSLFIAFLDDDDEWHPSYLEECLAVSTTNHSNIVATGFYRFESDVRAPIECLPPKSLNEDLFLRGNPGIQSSNLFLSMATMLMAGGFDERLQSCTDRDLCIRLCESGSIRYCSINKPLLNHYADNERQRLSKPNSPAKKNGLAVFWQKYNARMNDAQREAFLERAQRLFNWQPKAPTQSASKQTDLIALILGIELASISMNEVSKAIENIHHAGKQQLVAFNLVLTANQSVDLHELSIFLNFLSQLGINYYNLCDRQVYIKTATVHVANKNIGYSAWIINNWQIKDISSRTNQNDVLEILMELGARQLRDTNLNPQLFKLKPALCQAIQKCRIDAAHARIKKLLNVGSLQLLGIGSEAVVMADQERVFKCIDYWKTRTPVEQIKFLQHYSTQWHGLPGLYVLDVIPDGNTLVLTYAYEASTPYQGGNREQVINLLHSCSKSGIVCNDIHPKNLINTQNEVKLIDYGSDIRPWNELGFEHMARRAYLTIHHADHPRLKDLMHQSLSTIDLPEMKGYSVFRHLLVGIDCNLKQVQQARLPLERPSELSTKFELIVGVITADAYKLLPLLNSIADLAQCRFLSRVSTIVLCNGCSASTIHAVNAQSKRALGIVQIISEAEQILDAESGVFGPDLVSRPHGQVGIAQARSMLQKYVGLACLASSNSIAWILDDDMRLDARAKQYLPWLPSFKQKGVDVLIGQYENSSPNPPLNGLRGQLLDLLHNLRWLDNLPSNIALPDRSKENKALRDKYPDYYYDLSRKHTAHIEAPFWLIPAYQGETVAEARARLFAYAPLLVTGYPLTRSIIPTCPAEPLAAAEDTVNRGGNTLVLNPIALTHTPNLIPKIAGREIRRSDMVWAIINKHHHGLSIKSAPFPVQHIGSTQREKTLDLSKVQDELMGSALYAGLQKFLHSKPDHSLEFTPSEITDVWQATKASRNSRLVRLQYSVYRIKGLTQALANYPELTELSSYLTRSFTSATITQLEAKVKKMNEHHVSEFLSQIVQQSNRFAFARKKIGNN